VRPDPSGSRMTPQLCGCRHLCQYAAENGLGSNLARLRDWCCICDDRTPCALCAPRDRPERRQDRDRRLEGARETGIESRPLSIWRRLGPRLPWLPVDQITRIVRTAGMVVLCSVGVVMVFAVQSALYHWAPLWARLYPACVAQRAEPNTLAGIVQHRIACATFATDMIRKQWRAREAGRRARRDLQPVLLQGDLFVDVLNEEQDAVGRPGRPNVAPAVGAALATDFARSRRRDGITRRG
jgi:hypothetical protein